MLYVIVSKLPTTPDATGKKHIFAIDPHPYYYHNMKDAEEVCRKLEDEYPEWENEIYPVMEK